MLDVAPLCPAGHLPHLGEIGRPLLPCPFCNAGDWRRPRRRPISPPVGEMSGRTRGATWNAALSRPAMTVRGARNDLLIRPATPADAGTIHASILALGRFVGEEHKITSRPPTSRAYVRRRSGDHGLVAEIAGEYAGMCLFFRSFSTWHGPPRRLRPGPLGRGAVSRHGRRRGVAAALRRADARQRRHLHAAGRRRQEFRRAELLFAAGHRPLRRPSSIHAAYGDAFQALADGDGLDKRGTA